MSLPEGTGFVAGNGTVLCYRWTPGRGLPVVFLNSLGTDHRIWDGVIAHLGDAPVLCMDKRGHGLSPVAPADMDTYARDAALLIERAGIGPALICGVSVGGMIAQALTRLRPDLVAGLILSNTGLKIGDAESWQARLDTLDEIGLDGMADAVLERWFSQGWRRDNPASLAGYRAMLTATPAEGYAVACRAIRDADLSPDAGSIRVPTVCLAGGADLATPPALVERLAAAIPGARFELLADLGHLPGLERPDLVAGQVARLREELG